MFILCNELENENSCVGCPFLSTYTSGGFSMMNCEYIRRKELKNVENFRYTYSMEYTEKQRFLKCPIKSIKGLLKEIRKHKQLADAGFIYDFVAYNKGLHDAGEIIKEYCGVEE